MKDRAISPHIRTDRGVRQRQVQQQGVSALALRDTPAPVACGFPLVLPSGEQLACVTKVKHEIHTFIGDDRDDWFYTWRSDGTIEGARHGRRLAHRLMQDVPPDWPAIADHYNRIRFRRNPIALNLEAGCPDCIHEPHDTVCDGYRAPLCGQDNDVCGCTTFAPMDAAWLPKVANS